MIEKGREVRMKKWLATGMTFALLFAFSGMPTIAAEKGEAAEEESASDDEAPVKKKKAAKSKTRSITGKLKSINVKEKTLTVLKKKKGVETATVVTVNAETKFKEVKDLAGLKAGDKVTAKYMEEGGKKIAKMVHYKDPEKEKAKRKAGKKKKKEDKEDSTEE